MNYFEDRYKKYVRFALALFLFAALAYVFFRYLLYCFLPFLTAFTVSAFLQKPINKIVSKTRLSRAFVVVLAIIIIFSLLSEAVYLLSGDPLDNVRQLTVKEEFSDNDLREPKPYYIWQLVDNDGKAIKHLHIEGSNSILDWFGR